MSNKIRILYYGHLATSNADRALFVKVLGMEIGKNSCRKSSGGPNQEKSSITEDKTFFNK
jgi:hypothetical protein